MLRSGTDGGLRRAAAAMIAAGAALAASQAAAQTNDALEAALEAVGGRAALAELRVVEIVAEGERYEPLEGVRPGGELSRTSTFALVGLVEPAAGRLRLAWSREAITPLVGKFAYTEIVDGAAGYITDQDGVFPAFKPRAMLPARAAAVRKEQWLLNPHFLLQAAAANPYLASDLGAREMDGRGYRVAAVKDPAGTIELLVDSETGVLARAETVEADPLLGDVRIGASFDDWRAVGGSGLHYPFAVSLSLDGGAIHAERRSSVRLAAAPGAADFALPEGERTADDAADRRRGEQGSQWFRRFGAIGVPLDWVQANVEAAELAPGVVHLTGGTHHSLAIALEDRIVLVEPPLYEARSEAVIAKVAELWPDKPIRTVVATHHHFDHIGGVRRFAAAGAEVVIGAAGEPFLHEVLARPHTVVPDALAQDPQEVTVRAVGDAPLQVGDSTRAVLVVPIPARHAADMVAVYLPAEKLLFNSDMYTPGRPGPLNPLAQRNAEDLKQAIADHGLAVEAIVGGHGVGTATFADYLAHIGG